MGIFSQGSEWRKWDLHVHSTASDGKLSPREVIELAKNEGLSVIALTDHHTVRNIDEAKHIGAENGITVISGIEFRTEYGAKSVHIIGLLPDEYDGMKLNQTAIEQLILDQLGLSRVLIEAKGRETNNSLYDEQAFREGMHQFQVDLKKTAELIHKYGGLVSVHAGNKANSIEEMRHDGKGETNVKDVVDSLGPLKEELLRDYIDICEIGSPNDKNAEFYLKTFYMPVITASDAHDKERLGRVYTWIKADPTFEGLRQIVYEPELRIRIQSNIPERKADYQVIEALEISHEDFGNQRIPFNPNLNTIIGGRSSGKSILLGAVAKLANYTGEIKDNPDYNQYIDTMTDSMKWIWRDHEDRSTRKVEYFPQTYINGLAAKSESTIKLIENILKDDSERRIAFENYESDISRITVSISNGVENLLKLQYKENEVSNEIVSTGGLSGVVAEIKKLTDQINSVKEKSTVKLTDEDEKNYASLKEERRELYETIDTQKTIITQMENLKSIALIKDISGDFIGLPDTVKNSFIQKLKEISEGVDVEWQNFIEEKIKEAKKIISDAEKRIVAIEADKSYTDGETYYRDNEALTELSNALEDEKKKEKHIADLIKKQNEIQTEMTQLRGFVQK